MSKNLQEINLLCEEMSSLASAKTDDSIYLMSGHSLFGGNDNQDSEANKDEEEKGEKVPQEVVLSTQEFKTDSRPKLSNICTGIYTMSGHFECIPVLDDENDDDDDDEPESNMVKGDDHKKIHKSDSGHGEMKHRKQKKHHARHRHSHKNLSDGTHQWKRGSKKIVPVESNNAVEAGVQNKPKHHAQWKRGKKMGRLRYTVLPFQH